MGFFDRFFGKKKEEPPVTPSPTYVPPEPPPLPAPPPPRQEPREQVPPPPVESRFETQPLTPQPVLETPAPAPGADAPTTASTTKATVSEETTDALLPDALAEEEDFTLSGLTTDTHDTALPQVEESQVEESQDVSAAGVVEEVVVGVGTRLEVTPPGARGLDIADTTSAVDEAEADDTDFDIPMVRTDGDGRTEVSHPQLDGQSGRLVEDEEDDLEGFDDAFERILAQGEMDDLGEDTEPAVATDQTEVRTLFSEIAANYIRPVKAFIIELRSGAARKEWLEMCQPAISSLGKSALGMGMEDVSDAVHEFETLLDEARASREGMVSGELRERILQHYQTLTDMLPATFVIDDTTLQSEGMIVNSLLKQIPEVGKVTIDKLYRAGLITIESFLVGAKEDLAVATGLPIWLAEKIVEKFKSYQQQLESGLVQSGKEGLLNRLEQLMRDLHDAHEAYETATAEESSNPSAAEDRRFYRQARQETQLQINVLLAELGAVDLANEIQRLSFEKRIERLRRYIAEERRS
ncbi:hypothetical protein J8C01_08860 [Chloracidobacterium sp. D]|uniref:hypothetical protein n=1 Tax=Chloracidobacterium sp. D TaxID=2821536 RepID=UPI001B8B92E4|nr:hypothetical protein [Chloracidobacterium sp. D]QUV81330.1 hypothetical protein J8C01_08860 [Chloracidobacterium sp. D]